MCMKRIQCSLQLLKKNYSFCFSSKAANQTHILRFLPIVHLSRREVPDPVSDTRHETTLYWLNTEGIHYGQY